MSKIKVGFDRMTLPQKRQMVAKVVQMTTGNPNFPGAAPYLAALSSADAALGDDITAAEAARAVSKIKTSAQNASEKAVDKAMGRLAGAVELEADGSEVKILSGGFEVQAAPTAATIPAGVANLSLSRGDSPGEIHGHFDSEKDADNYLARYSVGENPGGPTTSMDAPFTKSNFDIEDLISGTRVWVEVVANNPAGPSPWSQPISIIVP
jgi:hypothetical protein